MRMNRLRWCAGKLSASALATLALLVHCAPEPRVYSNPDLIMHEQTTVAVLPFDNLTGHEGAAKQVHDIFLVEFLKLRRFAIVDPGEVERAITERRIRFISELSREQIQELGRELNSSILIQGSVLDYGMRQVQGFQVVEVPYVSVVIKIVDTVSGEILWAGSHSRNGNDTEKLFGFGRITSLNRLTEVMAKEIVESLERAFKERGVI